ncbi:MAG: inositol monophosphatase [Planctomycetales bacterium 71-10]|nr:MAG: inositol monophosphatase [Planctomycetales bacterium 71-10]
MTPADEDRARSLLCGLQDSIRDAVIAARHAHAAEDLAEVAVVTAADTIYRIDKISESAVFDWFESRWPREWPVELVMEGVEDEVPTFPRGTPVDRTALKCILDPIDGTRGLMYDKRSAWILAALAPQRGDRTNLGDVRVAAMTELPTTKQWASDQVSGVRGCGPEGLVAERVDIRDGGRRPLPIRPSRAADFRHGFAALARFFPEGKELLARVEERIWEVLHGRGGSSPVVFEDQYLSTGGQLYELMVGHDRMLGDLRPLAHRTLGIDSALVCHPYDICTAMLLQEAGGVVEAPDGRPLDAPLDTTSPVSWMGYANPGLADLVRPVLSRLMEEHLR